MDPNDVRDNALSVPAENAQPSLVWSHPPYPYPRGVVVEATTGEPLADVPIQWVMAGSDRRETTVLGATASARDGSFLLSANQTPEVLESICRLAIDPEQRSLVVAGETQHPIASATYERQELTLTVSSAEEPGTEAWQLVADFLATNRMFQVWQLADQLTAPPADSPIAGWSAGQRAGALATIHRALANERQTDALQLREQEHFLDLESLAHGETSIALNVFRDLELFDQYKGSVGERLGIDIAIEPGWWPDWFPTLRSDRELYRDYLRGIWVTTATAMHAYSAPIGSVGSAHVPTASALETQLDMRFHQNFRTHDVTAQPVHQLLVPIVRDILATPTDRGGFGMVNVPPQDDQTDAEYAATLIDLTGESPQELRNRFRIRVERPIEEQVSPIDLNIESLQGLLSDTWQSPREPFDSPLRGIEAAKPLLFLPHLGRAPFFLQYEEWLERQRPFHAENVYEIRRNLPAYSKEFRDFITAQTTSSRTTFNPYNNYFANQNEWQRSATFVARMFPIVDTIRDALTTADRQSYQSALEKLAAASALVVEARREATSSWNLTSFVWYNQNGVVNDPANRRVSLESRSKQRPKTTAELEIVERWFDPPSTPVRYSWENFPSADYNDLVEKTVARARTVAVHHLVYLDTVLLPYLKAGLSLAIGDLPVALRQLSLLTGYEVGIAEATDPAGYHVTGNLTDKNRPLLYAKTSLPYTTAVTIDPELGLYADGVPPSPVPTLPPFELRFLRLAQGEIALGLADQLYRNDDPASIRRTRELYKGVVFIHGDEPSIAPHFPSNAWQPLDPFLPGLFERNPAISSQLARANLGLTQIELGLNAYGYHPDMVPVLRYAPLKQAADRFAASAKAAQSDYLSYMTRFEQAQIDTWHATSLVKQGEASVAIAAERIEIAQAGVAKAQQQVDQVKAQIAAKRKEIEDADDFFSQAKDFFGGMKDALTGMVPLAEKVMNDDSAAESVTGAQLAGIVTKGMGGTTAAKDAAIATLGSGAGMAIGFGAFAYAGYTSMSSMADAAAKRSADLKTLETTALGAAEAQVTLAKRDVTIGQLQKSIAQAEFDYAKALARFQQERFLSVELWNKLAAFANRTMRRYVDLGARSAWLAERALAYEQHREVRIVKLNYLPIQLRGVTGADRLQLDLAELEADRLQGIRARVPVKHTFSLARDFPMQFGQLKKTGRCAIQTDEAVLRGAYPGMYGFRARAVNVSAQTAQGAAPRGTLRNIGVSVSSREDGSTDLLVRFPDALALSEFRLQDDLFVYGLPGETLLQFEGSGLGSLWEIEFPLVANADGLRSLTDVLITFDMHASYSHTLAATQPTGPISVTRSVLLAASVWDPEGLASLKATSGPIRFRFPLRQVALPTQEQDRTITNLALLTVGRTTRDYPSTIRANQPATTQASFTIEGGVALSNAGPLLGTGSPQPLNALVGLPLDQPLIVEIDRSAGADELKRLFDVVLLVEYSATV